MTNIELALTNLKEASAVEIHKKNDSIGIIELKNDAKEAGDVIKSARESLEEKLGSSIISSNNYIELTEDIENN